ncbi:MAG TPA: tripartite tricarboxylate transporter permease [Xanthobacteraceae bacterium]|nr:tripartite tricarboxylate transporter permease [Xanthobacteraceae bacterium]
MILTSLTDLWYGFGVALEPHNLMFCFIGVLIGNMVGVLPGMGPLATISILLPLTFGIKPVGAILMLAGVMYGAQYGGAICSILLNLPCHPPHAVTCLDGYPMTKQGRGGVALGVTVLASFVGASWGITEMVFLSPLLVRAALQFGPAEICSLMLLGLLAGSTLARGSPIKGVAMTVLGLMLGIVGSDIETGSERFTFGLAQLDDGIELIALALGLFGIAEFMNSINQIVETNTKYSKVRLRDMRPSKADLKQSFFPMLRGTIIGSLCALIPGTGPTIASFVSYAAEKKISKTPERFGHGAIEGVVCPEASTHSSVQGDFIPTMSLGIPGDAVMALLLGALMIQGIVPGPQLITQHPDIFWGLVASFWVGNILLVLLNVPLIGVWVKLLTIPYRYLYPSALFFVCIGVYAANNDMFQVGETLVIGILGYVLLRLGFHPAPILLGFVLGPRFEENFRRAMLISRGDLAIFVERPISAVFVAICVILIAGQIYFRLRGAKAGPVAAALHAPAGDEPSRWPEQATAPAEPGLLSAGASRLSALRLRGKLILAVVALGLAAAIGFGWHHTGDPASLDLSAQKKIQAQPPR